jgi:DNA excision repair protein ERCC-2
MKPQDLENLMARLTSPLDPILVLAVQGGALAEGIDLNSPYLKGAFIVGPAIPMVTFERELLRKYYDEKFGDGFSYAYIYPAMARSIQASGRVIRSEDKRGLIVMMDNRFIQHPYVEAMPSFWFKDSPKELVSNRILGDISEFWEA